MRTPSAPTAARSAKAHRAWVLRVTGFVSRGSTINEIVNLDLSSRCITMPYVVKSTLRFAGSPLPRHLLAAFVAICFFSAASGAIGLLHHHDNHNGPADSQCQVCYLLTVAAIGQVVALIALFVAAQSPRRHYSPDCVTADSADRLVSASPRAPPLR